MQRKEHEAALVAALRSIHDKEEELKALAAERVAADRLVRIKLQVSSESCRIQNILLHSLFFCLFKFVKDFKLFAIYFA